MFEFSDSTIVVFGAGGHAKSVISVLEAQARWRLAGLLEEVVTDTPRQVLGYPVLGDASALDSLHQDGVVKAFVAIGHNKERYRVANMLESHSFELISVVHPSTFQMIDSTIGAGSFVSAFAIIGSECQLGRNAIVQPHAGLSHETRIGECVQFCVGATIGGQVTVGDFSFFGPGSVVYPKITIGRNVSIGANSVVDKDVPDDVVVTGNPAQIVHYKNKH